jgi:hypothetical protein
MKPYFFPSKLSESRNQERINKNCFVVLGIVSVWKWEEGVTSKVKRVG